jgi:hypothetical protein
VDAVGSPGRLRQVATILVFDLGGPLLAYALLRPACLGSVRLRRPLIFRLAVEIPGPGTPKGRDVTAAWRYLVFRRAFQVITVAWGVSTRRRRPNAPPYTLVR